MDQRKIKKACFLLLAVGMLSIVSPKANAASMVSKDGPGSSLVPPGTEFAFTGDNCDNFTHPSYPGAQIYCARPGAELENPKKHPKPEKSKIEEIVKQYNGSKGYKETKHTLYAGHPQNPNSSPSCVYYKAGPAMDLSPAASYICATGGDTGKTIERQRALYNLGSANSGGMVSDGAQNSWWANHNLDGSKNTDYSTDYDEKALVYANYDNNLKQSLQETGGRLLYSNYDPTSLDLTVNRDSGSYTLGPFSVDVYNGNNINGEWAGFDKTEVQSFDHSGGSMGGGTLGGNPGNGSGFSVSFDSQSGEVGSVLIRTTYRYTVYKGRYNVLTAVHYVARANETHGKLHKEFTGYEKKLLVDKQGKPILDDNGRQQYVDDKTKPIYKDCYEWCQKKAYVSEEKTGQDMISVEAWTETYEEEIIIGYAPVPPPVTPPTVTPPTVTPTPTPPPTGTPTPTPTPPPTTTPHINLSISLGGNVWEDGDMSNKSNTPDGLKGKGDRNLEGITVTLYDDEGTNLGSTTTNSQGNYVFNGLNAMKRYRVEFTYNGQVYTQTQYYVGEKTNWAKNSKGQEKTGERAALNQKFATIGENGISNGGIQTFPFYQLFGSSPPTDSYAYTVKSGMSNKQQQYIQACSIKAYTQIWPEESVSTYRRSQVAQDENVPPGFTREGITGINMGLIVREKTDMALRKDIDRAATKINGKTEIYNYPKRREDDSLWEIGVRNSDASYYGTSYSRGIYPSDHQYRGPNPLEVYITYQIRVRNQSQSIQTRIDSIADYHDSKLQLVSTAIGNLSDEAYYHAIDQLSSTTPAQSSTKDIIPLGKTLKVGEEASIFVTYKINFTRTNSDFMMYYNVAEINQYSTFYPSGTIAGLVDVDSTPGNASYHTQPANFEDDTDRAQGLNIYAFDSPRTIDGTVWEDERNQEEKGAMIGDGIYQSGSEKTIAGIGVELHEVKWSNEKPQTQEEIAKIWNGSNWVEAKTRTGANGGYQFSGYIPGDYVVRFTYGGTDKDGTEYNTTYHGQDYKSTIYQAGIDQQGKTNAVTDAVHKYEGYTDFIKQNESASYGYSIEKSNTKRVSDAKDLWALREKLNEFGKDIDSYQKALALANYQGEAKQNQNAQMKADTGVIAVEVEFNKTRSSGMETTGAYHILNVDFGLVERPKAQLALDKTVNNVKITLANSNILFDATKNMNNLLWQKAEVQYSKEPLYREVSKTPGIIQATMDEEIMHGATIQITYDLTVTNIGEVDYQDPQFYYTGSETGEATNIVHTSAEELIDYVENNLQYRVASNEKWQVAKKDAIKQRLETSVGEAIKKYNTILTTTNFGKPLTPLCDSITNSAHTVATKLVLTQLITSENSKDDMNYENTAEIIHTKNDVGRKMAFSVIGNQNPTKAIGELDSSRAETVKILPPFGEIHSYQYVLLGASIFLLLGISIIFIQKKVLNS